MAFAAGAEIVLSLLQRNAYASKLGQGSSPAPPRTEIWYHCQRSNPVGTTPLLRSDMIFGRHSFIVSHAEITMSGYDFRKGQAAGGTRRRRPHRSPDRHTRSKPLTGSKALCRGGALLGPRPFTVVMGCRQRGVEPDRQVEIGNGAVEIALVAPSDAAVDQRAHKVRIDLKRLIEVGNGPVVALLLVPYQAALVIRVGVREPQSDGAIKVDERAIEITPSPPQDTSIAQHAGVIRIDANRRLLRCTAGILVTLAAPCVASVAVSQRLARAMPNGLIEVGDRPSEVAPAGSEFATGEVECRILRGGCTRRIVVVVRDNDPILLGLLDLLLRLFGLLGFLGDRQCAQADKTLLRSLGNRACGDQAQNLQRRHIL